MALSRQSPCWIAGRKLSGGFSLVEILVVVGVIAILAAISIPVIANVTRGANESAAESNLDHLNQAVLKYNNSITELTNAVDSGISDEQAVFALLQVRDAAVPGTPFLQADLGANSSASTNVYRARWNGRVFEIITPGTAGTGVNLSNLF